MVILYMENVYQSIIDISNPWGRLTVEIYAEGQFCIFFVALEIVKYIIYGICEVQ